MSTADQHGKSRKPRPSIAISSRQAFHALSSTLTLLLGSLSPRHHRVTLPFSPFLLILLFIAYRPGPPDQSKHHETCRQGPDTGRYLSHPSTKKSRGSLSSVNSRVLSPFPRDSQLPSRISFPTCSSRFLTWTLSHKNRTTDVSPPQIRMNRQ